MNELSVRRKPVEYLENFIGIKEGSTAHKTLIATFNKSGLCKRYTMTTKDAWCATAVSASFIATGLSKIFPCVECSCLQMMNLAKRCDIWVESDSYMPQIGDVVLYDWQDNGKGDCQGTPDHVGIVSSVGKGTFTVIEGNYSDTVKHRTLKQNGKYIRGFITPKYSLAAKEIDGDVTKEIESQRTEVSSFYDANLKGTYKTTGQLNVRKGAGTDKAIITSLPKGAKVNCGGYYSKSTDGTNWLSIVYKTKKAEIAGFCSIKFLKRAK